MQSSVRSFRQLIVWQRGHDLVLAAYKVAAAMPRHEQFGLASQLRQAVVSVPANIAEGFGRSSSADKARILNIAQGSLEEVKYFLLLARDLRYDFDPSVADLAEEVGRLLGAYRRQVVASCDGPRA
jgi:four helix bundle protein